MLPLSEIGSHACAALLFRPCNQVEDRSYLFGRCLGIDNRGAVTEGPDVDDSQACFEVCGRVRGRQCHTRDELQFLSRMLRCRESRCGIRRLHDEALLSAQQGESLIDFVSMLTDILEIVK